MAVEQGNGEVPVENNGDSVVSGEERGESVSVSEKGEVLISMEKSNQVEGVDLVSSSVRVDTSAGNGEKVKSIGNNEETGVDLVPEMEVDSVGNLLVPSGDIEIGDISELAGREEGEECAGGDSDTGTCKNGVGGPARKRRKVESSDKKSDVVESTDGTNCNGDNDNEGQVPFVEDPGCAEDSLQSPLEIKMVEENGSEEPDHTEKDDSNIDVRVKHQRYKNKARSVGRERKRPMGESSVCNDSDSTPVKKVKRKPIGETEVVRRILRSGTVLTSGNRKTVNSAVVGGFAGDTGREEADDSLKEDAQVERDRKGRFIRARDRELKKGRGRPHMTDGEVGGDEKKGHGTVDTEKVPGNQLNGRKEKKKKKDGRGRPRKTDRVVGGEEKKDDDKTVVIEEVHGNLNGRKDKKKKKDGRGRPRKTEVGVGGEEKKDDDLCDKTVDMEEVQGNQLNGRKEKNKKKDGRGRPRKTDREVGGEEKKGDDLSDETLDREKVTGNGLNGRKGKKKKKDGRGRPAKARAEYSEGNKENDDSCKESDGTEKVEVHQTIGRRIKKRTGFRGRPPKAHGNVLGVAKKVPITQIARGTRSSGKIKNKEGSNQERPPKLLVESGRAKVSGCQIQQDSVSDETGNQSKSAKVIRDSNVAQKGQKIVKRAVEKQLLRERISAMLKSAGWTIEYRPRMSKEYLDAVYVSPKGRTHWSVTLAYKVLKKQVEDGTADKRAVSAFTPIPDEEFSKLFRVTQKKEERKGNAASGKKVKKSLKVKHAIERKHKKKRKEKLGSSRNKQKPDCQEGGAAKKSRKGMRLPKREVKPNKRRFALLVRESRKCHDRDGEDIEPSDRKSTLLSWMIDLGTLQLDAKVLRMKGTSGQGLLEGRITIDGIHCDCCNNTFSISDFELHSGNESNQPFQNIYLESGTSLSQCLLESWMKYKDSVPMGLHSVDIDGGDPNDDTCNMCGDGGDLICCDGCPSTFHQNCLNIQNFPSGDWHCVYCSCKYCGTTSESSGRRDGNCDIQGPTLLSCRSCEQKYHPLCIPENSDERVNASSSSFCGKKCQEVFERLQVLLGVKHELEDGYSWTFIQRSEISPDTPSSAHQNIECHSKLAVAYSIMDECFLPILDERSGITMIRNVVYSCGSNITRLNYTGFFTAILEKGDDMISVASIRIHGNYIAEMPFIGTRHMYRRQGMCRRLLNAIESALCSLNVEKLVIPAISELHETWTSVFGFSPLDDSSKQVIKSMNMVVFPGVAMLQKPIPEHKCPEENIIVTAVTGPSEPKNEKQKINRGGSAKTKFYYSRRVVSHHSHKKTNVASASDSALHLGNATLNDAAKVTSETVASQEPKKGENVDPLSVTHGNKVRKRKAINLEELPDASSSEDETLRVHDSEYRDCGDSEINGADKPDSLLTSNVEDIEKNRGMSIADGSNPVSRSKDILKGHQAEPFFSSHNGHISVGGDCDDDTRLVSQIPHEIASLSSAENKSSGSGVVGASQTSCSGAGIDNHNPKEDAATVNDPHTPRVESRPKRPQRNTNLPKMSDVDRGTVQVAEQLCNSSSSSATSLLCTSGSCNPSVTSEVKSSRSLRSGRLC